VARLSWLHLSDLMIGARSARLLEPEYRDAFEQDLRRLHARSGPWDLVLISGNLTATGSASEFSLLGATLESLWKYLNSLGSDPTLLVVPGPRDSDPELFSTLVDKWQLDHSTPRLQAFRRGLLPGDFVATVGTEKLRVGVVGLNSIPQADHASEAGIEYAVDLLQLEAVTPNGVRQWVHEHDLLLLLTHRPPAELLPASLERLLSEMVQSAGFTLHLCGRGERHSISPPTVERQVLHLPARSLFGLESQTSNLWGYSAGEVTIDLPRQQKWVRLFPRVALVSDDSVRMIPDDLQQLEEDEGVMFPFGELHAVKLPGTDEALATVHPVPETITANTDVRVVEKAPELTQIPVGVNFLKMLRSGRDAVRAMAWSPSGDALAVGLSSGRLVYWKPDEAIPRWTIQGHTSEILNLCFSPDSGQVASVSRDRTSISSAHDGAPIDLAEQGELPTGMIAWAPNDALALARGDGFIRLLGSSSQHNSRSHLTPLGELSCMAWTPDGRTLAVCEAGRPNVYLLSFLAAGEGLNEVKNFGSGHKGNVHALAWMPDSPILATAGKGWFVRIWNTQRGEPVAVLQAHMGSVLGVSFSFDGKLLASKSMDGTVRLFRTDTWDEVAQFEDPVSPMLLRGGIAFSPTRHVLATMGAGGRAVRIWNIDMEALLSQRKRPMTAHAVSAKVVLVGEGRAGKSSLALRMAQGEYQELGSTHGMRFWTLAAEALSAESSPAAGVQRELILWDMGGQEEYRQVHQLFLKDASAALMVMEPGRGQTALDELEGWNQHLVNQTRERPVRKLLVGTKMDDEHAPVNTIALQQFVKQHQFADYMLTSAKTGRGISELKMALSQVIDWEGIERISQPALFQRLREHIYRLREARRVVLTFTELEEELRREFKEVFDPQALRAVVAQLARQGLVADTRMADGTRALILEVEQVERYASSLILAARDNPHGVPAIDMAKMQLLKAHFPRIKPEERLRRDQELIVLDCVIQLLLEHGLCLRHEGLLIFPSLFQPMLEEPGADLPHAVSLLYDFSGAIDNIYASLVTSLAISQRFGPPRLWKNRAEFGRAGEDASGVRRVQQHGQGAKGQARLDVYFAVHTPQSTRDLFVSFIEDHLHEQGVDLVEKLDVTCVCGQVFPEAVVQARIDAKKQDIICPVCEHRTPLTLGAQQALARNPELVGQLRALRTRIREQRSQSITETKVSMTEAERAPQQQDMPIRILHLSDIHVGAGADPMSLVEPLVADLRDTREGLGIERLDYLVISGDITNRATPEEFEKARELVSKLNEELGVTAERCIIVPGNHDLHWDTEVYTYKKKRQVDTKELHEGRYHEQEDGYLLRDEARYPERFRNFSQHFYHPLLQKEYPLLPEQQCIPSLFSETRLQFLAMNSAWEIDEYFQDRSSIAQAALARGFQTANQQVQSALKIGALADGRILRIAVWHHPITGNEKIRSDAFMEQLAQQEVRVCLHGHVHEDRAALVNHLHPTRKIHVVGAGSFGAPTSKRRESVPRLVNLLEVSRDLRHIRVRTRCLRKQGGAWEGWAIWPGATRDEKRTYYDVPLP
jgi:small GTP-binding protein